MKGTYSSVKSPKPFGTKAANVSQALTVSSNAHFPKYGIQITPLEMVVPDSKYERGKYATKTLVYAFS